MASVAQPVEQMARTVGATADRSSTRDHATYAAASPDVRRGAADRLDAHHSVAAGALGGEQGRVGGLEERPAIGFVTDP